MSDALPDHWYEYDFPLTNKGPTPSKARYYREDGAASEGCSWLIEFFAEILGEDHADVRLWYENNSPENRTDEIILGHPLDKLYLPEAKACRPLSPKMMRYNQAARQSQILKLFEDNSPAGIKYFQKIDDCLPFFEEMYTLPPNEITEFDGFTGHLDGTLDTVDSDKIDDAPITLHDSDGSYLQNDGDMGDNVEVGFQNLDGEDPDNYRSVTVRLFDKKIGGSGTSAGITMWTPDKLENLTAFYSLTSSYSFHQFQWDIDLTKQQVNDIRVIYKNGANLLEIPVKRFTAIEIVVRETS